jgi:hypothetical protein
VLPFNATSTFFCLRFEVLAFKRQYLNVFEDYKQIETYIHIYIYILELIYNINIINTHTYIYTG